ncbi:hypothetical protein CPB83DRAFT_862549 [Crepidotus variabilis]|uniref:Ribosomal protein/NADH dehydrogenase domain-containing protein n=1 Tax=Crepidotus variabilis TaxID=179855 RepID=A0A9P6JJV5_9AGAR|nr:hypothetical protein CPB83DRAFT_862549 [Crepidotus variabilis]
MASTSTVKTTLPRGIHKLSKLLEQLNQHPRLTLSSEVKSLRLTLSAKNDHWGAKHFIQNELPRIRYANPNLAIEVHKWPTSPNDKWRPEIEVALDEKKKKVVNLSMHNKLASSILTDLMDQYGGEPWKAAVAEAKKKGTSVIPEEVLAKEAEAVKDAKTKPQPQAGQADTLPNLWEYLNKHPDKRAQHEETLQQRRARRDRLLEKEQETMARITERKAESQESQAPA